MGGVKGASADTKTKGRGRGRATGASATSRARLHLGGAATGDKGMARDAENDTAPKMSAQGADTTGEALDRASPGAGAGQDSDNGIKIEIMAIPGRGGRQQSEEKYPFSKLTPSKKDPKTGELVGPTFLILEEDNPENVIAAARKRHKDKKFITRKQPGGVRVWMAL